MAQDNIQKARSLEQIHDYPLLDEVIDQLGCNSYSELLEILASVRKGGSTCGFHGFINSVDLLKFWQENKTAIKKQLLDKALDSDYGDSTIKLIKSLHYFKDVELSDDQISWTLYGSGKDNQIVDSIGWFILDELAQLAE